ncbi:regulatory-associated protein of mTOR-like isoform X2 [Stegodyphus dumicola]|nr:regulatory-associated protein of mTOR-like isoform X2 [Stegodyphus dumicola]
MGAPSIYVYDCSCAGLIVDSFEVFAKQHEREFELLINNSKTPYDGPPLPSYSSCIQLAACSATQILPMNPDLPADLFTSCLTTPVNIALKWFVLQSKNKLLPDITMDLIDQIPGQVSDRRTMLGELNWIFTAITDTIAWNVLPKETFQRLFRQDLLVASLFRNFLLAERIMRYYNCTPVSSPPLPSTYHHPMWQAWDLAVDLCLAQLPGILEDPLHVNYSYSPFFSEQLTAFQVWLSSVHNHNSVPEQLPIVLQVLLSQVHRLRALELLGRFLDLGPWAVNLALSVGIFPYVLKLLQSSARELRPLLVFIWAKVLAVDCTCQSELVRDGGFKYFLGVLGEQFMPAEHRTMAAFCVACIVHNYRQGQVAALQNNVVAICLEQLNDPSAKLRQWVAICLGEIWANFEQARWCGVRDSAHEKLEVLLTDPEPEVRAAAVYALGTFLNSTTERTDHANAIDHSIGMVLINKVANDGSPLVRMELVVALQWFLVIFENQFVAVGFQYMDEEKAKESSANHLLAPGGEVPSPLGMRKVASRDRLKIPLSGSPGSNTLDVNYAGDSSAMALERLRRVSSSTSISSIASNVHSPYTTSSSLGYASVFGNIWKTLISLSSDPYPDVAKLAEQLINYIKQKVIEVHRPDSVKNGKIPSMSEPSSPSGRPSFLAGESPPTRANGPITHHAQENRSRSANRWSDVNAPYQQYQYFAQFNRIRKTFDKGPEIREIGEDTEDNQEPKNPLIKTQYVAWSSLYFSQPVLKIGETDIDSPAHLEKEWLYLRNECMRKSVVEEVKKLENGRFDEQIFINKNPNLPAALKFHPYESHMVVTDKECYSIWDWEKGYLLRSNSSHNLQNVRITALDFINTHDDTLLMIGSDDGAVKLWKNYVSESDVRLVTAFQIIQDLLPSTRGSGLVLQWEQHSLQLLASGDVRHIRIWDAERESKVQDIPTSADSCLTCLSSNPEYASLVVAGCGDGTVRVYDRRLPHNECGVHIFQEHSGWVVNVLLQNKQNSSQIVSGSVAGDVRFWDLRHSTSVKSIPPTHGMTAMAIHTSLDLIACGAASQFISVFNQSGENVSTIKYHDGFMGHRIGPISCLAFHPYKASLAAGSTDSLISVYSVNRKH